jgi:hypothetical protein
MKILQLALALTVATLVVAACDDAPAPPTAEQLAERDLAFRYACAATDILRTSADNLATIEGAYASADPADPLAMITQRATVAALEYARAYDAHARLRAGAFTHMDSAVNHSPTRADSTRYMERAASFAIRTPEEGTVEGNVLASYQTEVLAILNDEDHRCNWDEGY